jgi:hypothetical protein
MLFIVIMSVCYINAIIYIHLLKTNTLIDIRAFVIELTLMRFSNQSVHVASEWILHARGSEIAGLRDRYAVSGRMKASYLSLSCILPTFL